MNRKAMGRRCISFVLGFFDEARRKREKSTDDLIDTDFRSKRGGKGEAERKGKEKNLSPFTFALYFSVEFWFSVGGVSIVFYSKRFQQADLRHSLTHS